MQLFVERDQSDAMTRVWSELGYLSVDMETATTYAVSRHFGVPAVSMLVVWDDVLAGERFLDPLASAEATALDHANRSVFEVALELAELLPEGTRATDPGKP